MLEHSACAAASELSVASLLHGMGTAGHSVAQQHESSSADSCMLAPRPPPFLLDMTCHCTEGHTLWCASAKKQWD